MAIDFKRQNSCPATLWNFNNGTVELIKSMWEKEISL